MVGLVPPGPDTTPTKGVTDSVRYGPPDFPSWVSFVSRPLPPLGWIFTPQVTIEGGRSPTEFSLEVRPGVGEGRDSRQEFGSSGVRHGVPVTRTSRQ